MTDQQILDAIRELESHSEPRKPDVRPPISSMGRQRALAPLFFLGPVLVLVGLVYLLSFLGD